MAKWKISSEGLFALILFVVFIAFMAVVVVGMINYEFPVTNSPELYEHVEVIQKRIKKKDTTYTYLVAFKFPDGSVKEFKVDKRKLYDAIHEGDTGTLIYKEREDISQAIENENRRWSGRRFVYFTKSVGDD